MRVNIIVSFENVEEIDAGEHSVDLADFAAAGMGPAETAGAIAATIEAAARKARAEDVPAAENPSPTGDYPLDPDQD